MASITHAQLRAFHAVATAGGFTRAAAVLGVTQPTLSGQVKALEQAYEIELFDRRGRQVRLTELGSTLLAVTRRLFGLEEEAEQLLVAAGGLEHGHLRVGADAPYHVIAALGDFSRRYPRLTLSVSIGNTESLLRDLNDHRIDVAVVANVTMEDRLEAMPIRHDRLVLFMPKRHRLAGRRGVRLDEIADEPLVLREPGSTTRRIFETALARAGVKLGRVLEIGSREAVREAVAAGLGIGVVSETEFGDDRRLAKVSIRDADVTAIEYAVCLRERRELKLIRAFLDVLRVG